MACSIMWFRRDLRLRDNPALTAAVAEGDVVCALVMPGADAGDQWGAGPCAWLHHSAAALDSSLRERGSHLVIRTEPPAQALTRLAHECGAIRVHCTRLWTPAGMAEEETASRELSGFGIELEVHESQYLVSPDALRTGSGGPYRVFSPYHRAWLPAASDAGALPAPTRISAPAYTPPTAGPVAPPPGGPDISRWWRPGESGALARLEHFATDVVRSYAEDHDRPDLRHTSELSPHLAFGEVSARVVVATVRERASEQVAAPFVRQLAWREFSGHVLHHFPHTLDSPLREEFSAFPWSYDPGLLAAWQSGRTGYPLVDAGMRQLLATGWMHNRVRLGCGSFLTKDLLLDWREGERHFRNRLADFDQASNTFNWQWVAGCGADAAPYFRVFNPSLQGAKFDPDGTYVRTWVPELAALDSRWIHRPWDAPAGELEAAGVALGRDYPLPVVNHAEARDRALAAFAAIKRG